MNTKHKIVIITGPSAVGKTTIAKKIFKQIDSFKPVASYTTRQKRDWSSEDKIMHFISKEEFQKLIAEDKLLEWALVHNKNFYGTSKASFIDTLKNNDVLLNIEVQGAKIIKSKFPEAVVIFILPENIENIRQRLSVRPISDEIKKARLETAVGEIDQSGDFDYQVVNYNNKVDKTVDEVIKILKSLP